jgi:hypothetical protein
MGRLGDHYKPNQEDVPQYAHKYYSSQSIATGCERRFLMTDTLRSAKHHQLINASRNFHVCPVSVSGNSEVAEA